MSLNLNQILQLVLYVLLLNSCCSFFHRHSDAERHVDLDSSLKNGVLILMNLELVLAMIGCRLQSRPMITTSKSPR